MGNGFPPDVRPRRRSSANTSARHLERKGKLAGRVKPRSDGRDRGIRRLGAVAGAAASRGKSGDSLLDLAYVFCADRRWAAELSRGVIEMISHPGITALRASKLLKTDGPTVDRG